MNANRLNQLINRAILLAGSEGCQITPETTDAWLIAAIADEGTTINYLINTSSGQKAANSISHNMTARMSG